ncbi:MAG TPA: hypothetical protein VM198_11200 [Longimicrobiales bacterium]|nr:hypothetical protein [Longimicrobiales bacterium]
MGAKHFEPTDKRHDSVEGTKVGGGFWVEGFWVEGFWAPGFWGEQLEVVLDGRAKALFGERLRIKRLVELVAEAWRPEFEAPQEPGPGE